MDERHSRLLFRQNPWWEKKDFTTPEFERDLMGDLLKYCQNRQILAVVGLRRVGKTVLLKQMIKKLLVKTEEKNVCYISFDDIDFQRYEVAWDLINYFLEFSDGKGMRYLFLDEVQKLPNFPDLLKTVYDTEENLKIFVSGSSSLELRKYRETLAGRILSFHLPVLSFREFVRYFGLRDEIALNENMIREYDLHFAANRARYMELFIQYLERGAFPELFDEDDEEYIKKYIRESVIEKTVEDISRASRGNENVVYELLRLLAAANAQLFELVNIAGNLRINRNQAAEYVSLLEKSFLIKVAYNYSVNVSKQVRASKKQFIVHPSIVLALLDQPFSMLEGGGIAGHLIESQIVGSLQKISFWRTPQKDEVDIVLADKRLLPVEVKYQTYINKKDIRSLTKFCEKYGVGEAVLVTRNQLRRGGTDSIVIYYIPAWLFSLLGLP
ncbi:MAG: ATP-binding protein [Candidatus Altiarchaeota archaeon]|nr:ATP-binding protein [Candidatus Altiarchaeota archaeon]